MKVKQLKEILEHVDDETDVCVAPLKKAHTYGNVTAFDEFVPAEIEGEVVIADMERKNCVKLVMVYEMVGDEEKLCVLGFDERYDVLGDEELLIDD